MITNISLTGKLLASLPIGDVIEVRIGNHWTAVVVEVEGKQRCGLAATLIESHGHSGEPDVPQAGSLEALPADELTALVHGDRPVLRSVGAAAINALLPKEGWRWFEKNAEEVIVEEGARKNVVIVGHFPFIARLRKLIDNLIVLEKHPKGEDFPEGAAPDILPQADIVAITGMAFTNGTLEELLGMCSPQALIIVLGPSTPISPLLFDYGVNLICGAVVREIDPVLKAVSQGANFRQVHKAGMSLVTLDEGSYLPPTESI
ncbi:MAG: hypothetical protein GTO18_05910 [Anaerolineales bacterium]|nr:hypothetical protein [Anaerolineales bacterium]